VAYDPSLTVYENSKFLTVSLCYSHLERIDELIAKNGMHQRYEDSRQFFERQLQRCLKKRAAAHPDYGE
jgi:hypothetical protein